MKIEPFFLERWMTAHELSATYDIAESGILPLSTNDLLAFEEPEERRSILEALLETPLGYSEASGSLELRTTLANTYRDRGPENILVTTGAIEANFLLFNVLLESGGPRRGRQPRLPAAQQRAPRRRRRGQPVEDRARELPLRPGRARAPHDLPHPPDRRQYPA